jgi:rubrerythrin
MRLVEYTNLSIKLIIEFFIMLGWAAILYPLMRKLKRGWPFLLITATLFSSGSFIIKRIMNNVRPIGNDIVAYLLGIFFGVAFLSLLFDFKNKHLFTISKTNTASLLSKNTASASLPKNIQKNPPLRNISKHIHLRHILKAGILMEERGIRFYNDFAKKAIDPKAKELCYSLVKEEFSHKALIEKALYRWLPLPLNRETLDSIDEQMRLWNIYSDQPDVNATEKDMARYAIEQETKMADFYFSFEESFPEAWKKNYLQMLVMDEKAHAQKMIKIYPDLYA